MNTKDIVHKWFSLWEKGDFLNLPLTEGFTHTSPFGTIEGRAQYLAVVNENRDKFLGYTFEILDGIYGQDTACVRYIGKQGEFKLDVSEWYYFDGHLIKEIVAYYHIGEIPEERRLVD